MPGNLQTISGEITDIFAHRFVVTTKAGKILADLGPKGAEQFPLCTGDHVTLSGEIKPSELKVHTIQKAGGLKIELDHKKPDHDHTHKHDDADPKLALQTVEKNGFTIAAGPHRKPKHFEFLGRDSAGDLVELHVELGGGLRKTRPTTKDDPKWAEEIRNCS